jgi:hypothetical protein
VSPTDQALGTTGDQGVVMHAGTVEGQPALATQRVIHGPKERGTWSEGRYDQLGQVQAQRVEVPGSMADEPMEAVLMAIADVAASSAVSRA